MARKKKYPKIEVKIEEKLTVDQAKELLGWTVVEKGEGYHMKDLEGQFVLFKNSSSNRPFRISLSKKYGNEMLRGKWKQNGETISFDHYGQIISGQHRLAALVLAEQERKRNVVHWQDEMGLTKPLTIPVVLIFGIESTTDVVDTVDVGQKRSIGDVLFRRDEFDKELSDREVKKRATILGQALNLLWKRWGGKNATDAYGHPHSETLDMLDKHPKLKDALQFILDENGGGGDEGNRIKDLCSLSIATAMMYLMGMSKSTVNPETGEEKLNQGNWKKAEEFWVLLASGENLKADHPCLVLSRYLRKQDGSGMKEREKIYGAIVKAWLIFLEDGKAEMKSIRVKEKNVDGKRTLDEYPTIGGLDVPRKVHQEMNVGKWTLGDYAWVDDGEAEPWKGKIVEFAGKELVMLLAEDNEVYETRIDLLSADEPETEEDELEDDPEDDIEEEEYDDSDLEEVAA